MTGSSRATRAGEVFNDLRNLARRTGRPTDELLTLYALEGFLGRLAESEHDHATFVLKGGVLLAAYDSRRPTRDVDMLALDLNNDAEEIRERVAAISARPRDDGLWLADEPMQASVIRDEGKYSGVRVKGLYRLASARIHFHIDVNVGDPVWPEPQDVTIPGMLDGPIVLRGYPITSVLAEKLVTAMQRGVANTRWRDFADVHVLTNRHDLTASDLMGSMEVVARHRQVTLVPLVALLAEFPPIAQARWEIWRSKQAHASQLPEQFADILQAIIDFGDPVITGKLDAASWDSVQRVWR